MKIEIRCKGSSTAKLEDLHEFQGELKELSDENYNKLKDEILDLGFSAPFFVWATVNGEQRESLNLLDGHQRKKTLKKMSEEGITLPESFPIVEVDAKSEKEAKRKVLAITSNYGRMTDKGLFSFADNAGIDMAEIADSFNFDAIDFEAMLPDTVDEKAGDGEYEPRKMTDQYLVPPFSVLDARQGYWKTRKDAWLKMGIKSEKGRDGLGCTSSSPEINKGSSEGGEHI